MKATIPEKIKTGIFVVVGVLLFLAIIVLIGKQQKLFSRSLTMHAHFRNVNGLQIGNYVRFGGINVGIVDGINITNDTTVTVDFRLEPRMKPFLKDDAVVSISSEGLMGDKLVQISPGSDSATLLKEGGQMKTIDPVDMDKIILKVSRITDNAEALTNSLAGIADRVNKGQGSIGMLLKNDTLAKRLQSTVAEANETVNVVKKSANNFNENMEAAKHNFLLRGYFRKKEKQRIKDSINNQKRIKDSISNLKLKTADQKK